MRPNNYLTSEIVNDFAFRHVVCKFSAATETRGKLSLP
jgi:hypothetical protein